MDRDEFLSEWPVVFLGDDPAQVRRELAALRLDVLLDCMLYGSVLSSRDELLTGKK